MKINTEAEIKEYFSKTNLDLRKYKFSRWTDQKITPDVVSFIAECVLNLPDEQKEFVTKDIWGLDYFIKNAMAVFNKPSPTNESARHEYDKFIQQPLLMLVYARILEVRKEGIKNIFKIKNKELLDYISIKEWNAYIFLYYYFVKVLTDSDMIKYFEDFRANNDKYHFNILKDKFIKFVKGNTKINTNVEIRRIFPKILNTYAVHNRIKGTMSGKISPNIFTFSDLMYNEVNFRDTTKEKSLTRQECGKVEAVKKNYSKFLIARAKNIIRRKYLQSEVKDSFAKGEAIHIHHIFPEADFPQIAFYLENLIKLTADQHLYHAHIKGNTHSINRDYQLTCLLAKSESIETSLNNGEALYTIPNFIFVINTGFSSNLPQTLDLDQIRLEINKIHNSA
ncbi:hypothetical protein HYW76_04420 [Candidatus Pacearchaeota archaeon]|nr:hypothetical protein [Candidatus Pacearchaeota archaeon]